MISVRVKQRGECLAQSTAGLLPVELAFRASTLCLAEGPAPQCHGGCLGLNTSVLCSPELYEY